VKSPEDPPTDPETRRLPSPQVAVGLGSFVVGDSASGSDRPILPATFVRDPDKVMKDGKVVGCSTSRVYSSYLRRMISLCVLDREIAVGTDVTVVWGNKGAAQKNIRATVVNVPFKEDKRRTDVTKL
jgi:glycine cleavage system aminomethyltransferase T